mmetsp:Transcript_46108/g.98501  ORF Transcript_46108/g.98501 Transcript_46108/m.98501 type:complete len:351 (+) Transcript_46108:911-1963(+)
MAHAPLLLIGDGLLVIRDVHIPLRGTLEDCQVLRNLLNLRTNAHGRRTSTHNYDILVGKVEALDESCGVACLALERILSRDFWDSRVAQLPYCTDINIRFHCAYRPIFVVVSYLPHAGRLIPRGALNRGLGLAILCNAMLIAHPLDVCLNLTAIREVLLPIRVWLGGERVGDGRGVAPHSRVEILVPSAADVSVSLEDCVGNARLLTTQGNRDAVDSRSTDGHMEIGLPLRCKICKISTELIWEPAHFVHDVVQLQLGEFACGLGETVQRHWKTGVRHKVLENRRAIWGHCCPARVAVIDHQGCHCLLQLVQIIFIEPLLLAGQVCRARLQQALTAPNEVLLDCSIGDVG